jgi:cytochrome P450
MSNRPPVADWATDFDHLDPRWVEDPFPIWDELRQSCPIAHTERFMGVYFPSRYDDVRAIAYDTEHFSSRRIIVRETPPPRLPAPPITSDPPKHRGSKQVLLPAFTPDAIKLHEPSAREICGELLGRLAGKRGGDAAADYAQEIPVRVIAHMLGLAEQDGDRFRKWIHEVLELGITDGATLVRALTEIQVFFEEEMAKRRARPSGRSDHLSHQRAHRRPATQ